MTALQLHTLTLDDYLRNTNDSIHSQYLQQQQQHNALQPQPTLRLKVLSLGESGVGKSCLIKRYCERKFVSRYICTIGVDYGVRNVKMSRDTYEVLTSLNNVDPTTILNLSIHFIDVAGGDEYAAIRSEFHAQTSGMLLVFDVNDRSTYDKLDAWVAEHKQCALDDSALQSVVVCGNKVDDTSNKRQVTTAEAQSWCKQQKFTYMETSANTGANVNEAFDALFKSIVQRQHQRQYT